MPPLSEVLYTALPPIVAAVLLVSWRGARLTTLAVSIGVFVAWCLNRGELPPWPWQLLTEPVGSQWLLWSVVGTGLLAWLEHTGILRGRIAVAAGMVFVAIATWLMLQKVAGQWSVGQVALYVGGGAVAAALVVHASRASLASAPAGIAPAVVFAVLCSALSVLLVVGAQDAPLGKLCGACAAAVGAAAGTWLWRRPFALAAADGTCLGGAWALLVIAGALLASLPLTAALLALLSPCAPLLLRPSIAQRPLAWAIASLAISGAPLAGALAIAFATHGIEGY